MEVDSWVSVQARRERFEQLYEDSPLPSSQTTPSHPTPRPKTSTSSNPRKNSQKSDEYRAFQGKNAQITNHERDRRISKYALHSESCMESCETDTSGKVHMNNMKMKEEVNHPIEKDQTPLESTVTPLSSIAKRIPLFKPATSKTTRKNMGEEEAESSPGESQGKRGRFFSHMRSRSHGNFVMKRDSSAEKNTGQQNGVTHKESKSHKDWLTPKSKQRSIDNLLRSEDSKSSSSFEGKQKLVSNIVKNMKNKETPTVLRKFSFSSKNEKDIKNMREKSVIPNLRHKQHGISSPASDKSLSDFSYKQKSNSRDSGINMDHKLNTEEKTRSHTSEIAMVPVMIAKAVAEVASRRHAAQTLVKTSSLSSLSAEDPLSDPPARPPRRRATGPGPAPRRKGKAPSPPGQSSTVAFKRHQRIHRDSSYQITSSDESPDMTSHRFRDSSDAFKSYESTSPCHSPEKALENSHDMSSTPVSKFCKTIHSKPKCKSRPEQRHGDDGKQEIFKTEIQTVNLRNIKANPRTETHNNKDDSLEEENTTEVECLPPGPPPKKPPRTFAYDIYKNTSLPALDIDDDDGSKEENTNKKSSPPIYAVPIKKKNNKTIPKPPIRSKSDLSKEIIKPSVAPKPPHVLAKAKRTSLVDPLSNLEKDEDAAITSEFQRRAHIRYSLRKPKKPPPSLPTDKNDNNQSNSEHTNNSLETPHDPNYSTINYESENGNRKSNYSRQKRHTCYMTDSSPGPTGINNHSTNNLRSPFKDNCHGEYEDVDFINSSNTSAENEQPLSLSHCYSTTPACDASYLHTKRSMSDETLYKGCRQEEPVYATPTFKTNKYQRDQPSQKELHYMCSTLFTDDEEADAGREQEEGKTRKNSVLGREKGVGTDTEDGSKGRSSLISAWKREFRQSYRQVQSRLKKTVIR